MDQFGIPMTIRLRQDSIGYDQTTGITLTRDQVFARYRSSVSLAFSDLATPFRIVAPRSSSSFRPGGALSGYLQAYIDQVWAGYSSRAFKLVRFGTQFEGQVVDDRLQFRRTPAHIDGDGPFHLDKPTTADVVACSGALAHDGMTTTELELAAELAAALNRGVAEDTANWYDPYTYYTGALKNDYSMFWHQISIGNRAYGFAYDDVNDQSSVQILGNANPPSSIMIGIGW